MAAPWRLLAAVRGLVIFSAGDACISPGRYPSKQEPHQQAPTWNWRGYISAAEC
ncbi:FMN-binding negative transcriptional regulator [Winslowiella toletana]|uniref:FMN-binding negative transcriptional regulator n=1 Tax=Winslowiella toletana TaxID=92490 RepID=UPI000A036610|nr:FMN-binding negative transcriptional regulator [Winslowiella toletana]